MKADVQEVNSHDEEGCDRDLPRRQERLLLSWKPRGVFPAAHGTAGNTPLPIEIGEADSLRRRPE